LALTGIAFHQTAPAGTKLPPPAEPSRVVPATPIDDPEVAHGPSRLDQSPDAERRAHDAEESARDAPENRAREAARSGRGQHLDITA
jgi:hypothetical protein